MINGKNINLEQLNAFLQESMSGYLSMEVIFVEEGSLKMRMPVDKRTMQPFGILNGGASMALVESAASLAANLHVPDDKMCVGLEINGNHIKSVRSGHVVAEAKLAHSGRTTQVWSVEVRDDIGDLVCLSRMTMAVMDKKR